MIRLSLSLSLQIVRLETKRCKCWFCWWKNVDAKLKNIWAPVFQADNCGTLDLVCPVTLGDVCMTDNLLRQDIAGIAASCEICAKSVLPCLFSLFSTQSLISFGAKGLTQFLGVGRGNCLGWSKLERDFRSVQIQLGCFLPSVFASESRMKIVASKLFVIREVSWIKTPNASEPWKLAVNYCWSIPESNWVDGHCSQQVR